MNKLVRIVFVLFLGITGLNAQNYKLVWEDNFDGNTLDSSKWSYETKVGVWNTGSNSELQHYNQKNVSVGDDGNGNSCLIITAKKESYSNYNFTSGKVTTKGKFAFKCGKMEAYIKMPDLANGLWPAFWTLGYTPIGWPDCGEIDVLEMGHAKGIEQGEQNSFIGAHLFWGPYPRDYGKEYTASEDLSEGYFKYTLVWDESKISVYFNDAANPYFSMGITGDDTEEYRNFQHYIILNMAVGGSVPGIFSAGAITAPMPANMYVDWVKVYQEEGKEDYNANLLPFGNFGIYEDMQSTDMSMNLGFDLSNEVSALTVKAEETPYEGKNVLAYSVESGANYALKLKSDINRDMTNYAKGSIQMMIKTTVKDAIQMGIGDVVGNEKMIVFSDANNNNFTRDGNWQMVTVALGDLVDGLKIDSLKYMLIVKGESSSDADIAIDQVIFKETAPAKGYYGILTDNPNITDGFVVDNTTNNLYIWNETVGFNTTYSAYEGENVLSWKSTGVEDWFGFGFHSSNALNFAAYANGYLNISIRTESTAAFYIGMDGEDSDSEINFDGSNDPYGLERDGEWHHISIPITDLTEQGLNLASINHVFKTGGGGSIEDIAYDNIYLSEAEPDIENSAICHAETINISPSAERIAVNESLRLSAMVFDQFGNAYENNIEWSVSGGSITNEGEFVADEVGEYTITASQNNVSATAIITVLDATGISDSDLSIISFYDNALKTIEVNGIDAPSTIVVYDVAGNLIYQNSNANGSINISMQNQNVGVYIIKVQMGSEIYIDKIVKQ